MPSTSMHDPILEARGIHAWYGSSHVLHGIELQIARGETLGLLGRNGMGKSTLIRTLLGHVTQRDGRIHLFGQDVSKARPHEVARRGVAYVPEGRGIFHNESKTFLLWVNEEDQLRIISMQQGGDVRAVFDRLARGIQAVGDSVKKESGKDFMMDAKYGFIHACPTTLGTGKNPM